MTSKIKIPVKAYFFTVFIFLCIPLCMAENRLVDIYSSALLAYYDFDQGQGTLLEDKSGKKHHGKISNNGNFWSEYGIYGGAGNFKGNTRVIVNNTKKLSKGQELTIMLWIKTSQSDERAKLVSKRNYQDEFKYFLVGLDKGKPYASFGDGNLVDATPKANIILGDNWHHLCFTFTKEKTINFYFDGNLTESVTTSQDGFYSEANLSLGSDFEGSEGYFEGLMDEFIILGKAVTQDEIKSEINRTDILKLKNTKPEDIYKNPYSFILAEWPINEGRGNIVNNTVTSEFSGALSNGLESRWKDGFLKNSLLFNGSGDHIQIKPYSEIDFKRNFSILCWIKTTQSSGMQKIVHKSSSTNKKKFYEIGISNGKIFGGIGDGEKIIMCFSEAQVKPDEWHQIGLILNNKTSKLQIVLDGKFIDIIDAPINVTTGNSPLIIGGNPMESKSFFAGEITDLKLFNIPLDENICTKFFKETKDKLDKIESSRQKKSQILNALKDSLRELNELNELLGLESSVEVTEGKEEVALIEIKKQIQEKLATLQKTKEKELSKLKELITSIDLKEKELNKFLTDLKQPLYESKINKTIPENLSIKDIIKLISEHKRNEVEINLFIRQKEQEIQLKIELTNKRQERFKNQINQKIAQLNELYNELGIEKYLIDENKVKSSPETYEQELTDLIENTKKQKDAKVKELTQKINNYRNELTTLFERLNTLAKYLNIPAPEQPDVSSPLTESIVRLNRLAKYAEELISKWNKNLKEYSQLEKNEIEKQFGVLKNTTEEVHKIYGEITEIRKKLGIEQSEPVNLPSKNYIKPETIQLVAKSVAQVENQKQLLLKEKASLEEKLNQKLRQTYEIEIEHLKTSFKRTRSKLLLLNSELDIAEQQYSYPKREDKESIQDYIKKFHKSIDDLANLISEREKQIEEIKKSEEDKRQKTLQEINAVIKELNSSLKILSLPIYPEQKIKPGQEQASLKRFKTELEEKKEMVKTYNEQAEKRALLKEKLWKNLQDEVNYYNQLLSLEISKDVFKEETVDADVEKLNKQLEDLKEKYNKFIQANRADYLNRISKERENQDNEFKSLLNTFNDTVKQINDADKRLNTESKPIENFSWTENFFNKLYGYYKFDVPAWISFPDTPKGNVIEVNQGENSFSQGRYNLGPKFDGKRQYVHLSSKNFDINDFTVLLWVKPEKDSGKQMLLKLYNKTNPSSCIILTQEQSSLILENSFTKEVFTMESETTLNKNEWFHLAFYISLANKRATIYFNGQSMFNKRIDLPEILNELIIGKGENERAYFTGVIDELVIFERKLDDSEIAKVGLGLGNITLKNTIDYLKNKISSLNESLKQKTEKLKSAELEKEKEKNILMEQLKTLNDLHAKLGEPSESWDEFEQMEPEYRKTIMQSRTKRTQKKYDMFVEQIENKRLETIKIIEAERERLKFLYNTLQIEGELFTNIEKGSEEQILQKIKSLVSEKETEYKNKLKDKEAKATYFKNEIQKITSQITEISAKLKINPPAVPQLIEGKEEEILNTYRNELISTQEKLTVFLKEQEQKFSSVSTEIEKAWEQLLPVLEELKEKETKPQYDLANAEKILEQLKTKLNDKQNKLKAIKETRQKKHQEISDKLKASFNELSQISNQLNEQVSFIPDYSENGVYNSLKACNELIARKKTDLSNILEQNKKAKVQLIHSLLEKIHLQTISLEKINANLNIQEKSPVFTIISNKIDNLVYYFKFDNLYTDISYDWANNAFIKLFHSKISPSGTSDFDNTLTLDGNASYAEIQSDKSIFSNSELGISLYFRPNRFWNQQSIVFIGLEKDSGLDIFINKNDLLVRYLKDGIFKILTKPIPLTVNQWKNLVINLDLKNNKNDILIDYRLFQTFQLSPSEKFSGNIKIGSYSGEHDFFAGDVSEIKIFNALIDENKKNAAAKVLLPDYIEGIDKTLEAKTLEISTLIKTREEQFNKIIQDKETKRQQVINEIETLKTELSKLTNNEKIFFPVIIGKEEQALEKIKEKVALAKVENEKKRKAEEDKLQKLNQEIETKEKTIEKLSREIGKPRPVLQKIQGQENIYLKAVDEQIKEMQNEILSKNLEIKKLQNKLLSTLSQIGEKTTDVKYPEEAISLIQKIDFLNTAITENSSKLQLKQREGLLAKLDNQYKTYKSIMEETGEEFDKQIVPEVGKELEALGEINEKISKAKEKLNKIKLEKADNIKKSRALFESLYSQLNPLLKELGQENLVEISFDDAKPGESLQSIKQLIADKTKEVEEKKKTEQLRFKEMQQTTEGLLKAIEEAKTQINGYVKELNIKDYVLPTALSATKKIESLCLYFKFDTLKDKFITDEASNTNQSFITNFSAENKIVGKYGFGIHLNGLDQFMNINLPDKISQSLQTTIAFWLNPFRTYGKRNLISSFNTKSNSGISIYIQEGNFVSDLSLNGKVFSVTSQAEVPKKTWCHFSVTIGNNSMELFLNGQMISSAKTDKISIKFLSSMIIVGSQYDSTQDLYSGGMDELRIYNAKISAQDINKSMEEEVLRSEVRDIELLKEEYNILQVESNKLLEKVKESIKQANEIKINKIQTINSLIEEISGINHQMEKPSLKYPYSEDKLDEAIDDLRKSKIQKNDELKEFEKTLAVQEQKYADELKLLKEKIASLHKNLNLEKSYEITLKKGLETEIINKTKDYIKELETEFEIQSKTKKEQEQLKIREDIYEVISRINKYNEKLEKQPIALSEIPSGKENETLKDYQNKLAEAEKEIETLKRQESQLIEEKEKNVLIKKYRTLTFEIESLQRDLNIKITEITSKQADPDVRVYLNFNDGRGNLVKDNTNYGNRASFIDSGFEWTDTGLYDKCIKLNGKSGKLMIYESSSLNEIEGFTILLWIKPAEITNNFKIFSIGEKDLSRLFLQTQEGRLIVGLGKDMLVDSGSSLQKDVWNHIALSFNKKDNFIRLFLNATMVYQDEYPEKFRKSSIFLNNPIYIGSNGSESFINGFIDEFKLFSRELTAEEIKDNQSEGIPTIDTAMEKSSATEIQNKINELETKIHELKQQKVEKDQLLTAKRQQVILENKILKEAVTNKNLKLYENLNTKINDYRAKLNLSPKKFPEMTEENESEIIEQTQAELLELKQQFYKGWKLPSLVTKIPSIEKFDLNTNVFCKTDFITFTEKYIEDNSSGGQEITFTAKISNWIKTGISNNAIEIGEHGYLKISNNFSTPYNLKQSFQLWIYPNEEKISNSLLLSRGNLNIEIFNGKLRVLIDDEIITFQDIFIKEKKWTIINFSLDELASKIYAGINFIEGETKLYTTRLVNMDGPIYIGGSPSDPKRFKGLLDKVFVYHRLLTSKDFVFPDIFNMKLDSQFTSMDLKTVFLEIGVENAEFMRVYQEGKMAESSWENFRNMKILPVFMLQKTKPSVTIIAEFKNRNSEDIVQTKVEVQIPEVQDTKFVMPTQNSEITTR